MHTRSVISVQRWPTGIKQIISYEWVPKSDAYMFLFMYNMHVSAHIYIRSTELTIR